MLCEARSKIRWWRRLRPCERPATHRVGKLSLCEQHAAVAAQRFRVVMEPIMRE